MSFQVGLGHSQDVDEDDAVEEVVEKALEDLAGAAPRAAIAFTTADYDHAALADEFRKRLPGVSLIGCSADGQLSSNEAYVEDGVALMVFGGDTLNFRMGWATIEEGNDREAARQAARQAARDDSAPSLVFTLPAGVGSNMDEIVVGLREGFGASSVPVFGGTAADHWKFKETFQISGGNYKTNGIPVLAVYGPMMFGHGVHSGWQTFGRPMTVTSAEGNILRTLDGQSAAKLLEEEFGQSILLSAGEYPLAVMLPDEGKDKFYLRAVLEVQLEADCVVLAGNIPVGAQVRLTSASRDQILLGSAASTRAALSRYPGVDPQALLVFSCAARKWLLGPRVQEEYEGIARELRAGGLHIPVAGFYSFGELAPHEHNVSYAHNETCVTLAIGVA